VVIQLLSLLHKTILEGVIPVMKRLQMSVLLVVTISLLMTSCSQPLQKPSIVTDPENAILSSAVTKSNDYAVSADNFRLEKSTVGGGSILSGELTSGVTVNARVYSDIDLTNPGMRSVDTAVCRVFLPSDIDLLVTPDWAKTSDQTSKEYYQGMDTFDQRIAEFTDENNNRIRILNAYANFDYRVRYGKGDLLSLMHDRIPWFSAELAWGTEDFDFGSGEEAFEKLKEYAALLGVTVSSAYRVEYVTPDVFETMYRIQIADGSDSWPEMTWGDEDGAYWIETSQDWNGLPISDNWQGRIFDGINLSGNECFVTSCTKISFLLSGVGVQDFRMENVYQLLKKGTDEELVSLWDALQALKVHIENPEYELEVLYKLPKQDVIIDRIELCYLPIMQKPAVTNRPVTELTEGLIDTESGGKKYVFQMTPCWTFRVVWQETGTYQSQYCEVNAITGEYILQTTYIE